MTKKIAFIFVLIIFLFLGGFFLFSENEDIFKNNRLLAAIKEFLPFEKSEEPLSPLVLLEQELREKYELLQKESINQLDDISERVDSLDQKVVELETQIQTLGVLIAEKEAEEETGIELENQESKEEKEEKEDETEETKEQEQIICQKSAGSSALKNKIIFNEIAWMGTNISANNEWIELKNISGAPINLTGWQILDKDNNIKIIFGDSNNISSNGFYLLERGEEAVVGIKADKTYTGSLNNENESLYLFDQNCQLQDEILANPDWSAGDNSSKRTMERKSDLIWQTSQNIGGTPKNQNSTGYVVVVASAGGGGGAPPPVVYPKILISEAKIAEKVGDKNIFIELYNPNNSEIDLTNWYIFRNDSSFITKTLLEGKKIPPESYFLIAKKGSIWENQTDVLFDDKTLNENDKITLKNPNGEIADEINWQDTQEGFSYGRIWDDSANTYLNNFEAQEPTPREKNKSPVLPQDIFPPTRTDGLPAGTLSAGIIKTTISLTTDEIATCKYSINPDQDYDLMTDTFLTTNGTSHSALITGLTDGISYNYYVRCVDPAGNKNTDDFIITFSITSSPSEEIPSLTVVINEIAWMGTKTSDWDEWIELFNNTGEDIALDGWKLVIGEREINLGGSIPLKGFYLLERAEKATDVLANLVYGGERISNNGVKLELRDSSGKLIDLVDYSSGWFAGTIGPDYLSMERVNSLISGSDSLNWQNSQNPGGTPKA